MLRAKGRKAYSDRGLFPAGVEGESARPSEEDHRLPGRQTVRGATGKAAAVLAAESESLFAFPARLTCVCGAFFCPGPPSLSSLSFKELNPGLSGIIVPFLISGCHL